MTFRRFSFLLFTVDFVRAACPFANSGSSLVRRRRISQFPDIDPYKGEGLLNVGKGCWGHCDLKAGNCSYCGTGQCCRQQDYDHGVTGCELANGVTGSRCGHFWHPNQDWLKNKGRSCSGHCDAFGGECGFCGSGQCCRQVDSERCVPGCEAANMMSSGPASQCGNWWVHDDAATDPFSCVPVMSVPSVTDPGTPITDPGSTEPGGSGGTGLLRAGQGCNAACRMTVGYGGNCSFCGTGQCCQRIDWYRGVADCELAENVTQAVCGFWSRPHPEPLDFRISLPHGSYPTLQPETLPNANGEPNTSSWLINILPANTLEDHVTPSYSGQGGQPWSRFEMALVRDLLLRETRRAGVSRDEVSGARMLRLAFHDCLHSHETRMTE